MLTLSPYTKYSFMLNWATPYDGNMPDVPSHSQDPQGPSLEWLKRLSASVDRERPPMAPINV